MTTLTDVHEKWLLRRGLEPELALRHGWHSERRKSNGRDLAIPFVRRGKVVNHKYRGPEKRFSQDEGAPRSFWNEDCLRDQSLADHPLIITEGEPDALSAIQVGYPRSVSVPDGAGSNLDFMGEDDLREALAAVSSIILAVDADEPGQKLAGELVRRLGAARCSWVKYPKGSKDLNDVLQAHGEAGVREVIEAAKPYPIKGVFRLDDYPDLPPPEVFKTGWPNLDPYLRIWQGEFMAVTGVPSAGKSLWTLNLLAQLAERNGHRALVASFEMPIVPFVRDILRRFRGGTAQEADAWINEHFVFVGQGKGEREDMTVEWLIERAEDAACRYGVSWFLLDPWNQIDHHTGRDSEEQYQRKAIRQLKAFAEDFEIGVMVVAHPTKDIKGRDGTIRKPTGYDIAGSAHWVNAPEHLVVLDRPDPTSNVVEVAVLKSRHAVGGMCGSGLLTYDRREGRYRPVVNKPDLED